MADTGAQTQNDKPTPESLTEREVTLVLDYLLSHRMAFTQDFLRDRDLAFSGTKARLRERLEAYLQTGELDPADLVRLLNTVEGWGNQQIYLYKAPHALIDPWSEEASVQERLAERGWADLLHRPRPLVLPEEPALSSIEWTPERVRFVWVEKRTWEERASDEDIETDDVIWRAYRVNVSRGVIAFEWDLVSGHAMLLIQRLPRGTQYDPIRKAFEAELEPVVGLSQFERVRVSRAIQRVQTSGEVRRRQLAYQTRRGGKARFTSASRSSDAFSDPDLERAERALTGEVAGMLGNFYWLAVEGKLGRELHTKLYALDQRVGIFGEQVEQDVRYVLSRIRRHCG